MIVGIRKRHLHIDGAEIDGFSCFEFLSVYIKDDLSWSGLSDVPVKTAQKSLKKIWRVCPKLSVSTGAPLRAFPLAASLPGMPAAYLLI